MSEKTKLKIGEFSKLMQVTVKTLRHYEQMGLLMPYEVDNDAIGSNLSIYTTDGRLLKRMPITSALIHLGTLPKALLLIQIEGRNVCPRALKIN